MLIFYCSTKTRIIILIRLIVLVVTGCSNSLMYAPTCQNSSTIHFHTLLTPASSHHNNHLILTMVYNLVIFLIAPFSYHGPYLGGGPLRPPLPPRAPGGGPYPPKGAGGPYPRGGPGRLDPGTRGREGLLACGLPSLLV